MIRLSLSRLTLLSAAVLTLCSTASITVQADALGFNDFDPANVAAGYDGFNFGPFLYNGTSANADTTYTFAKGQDLSFSGNFNTGGNDVNDATTYIFVTASNPTVPWAELNLNILTNDGDAAVSGTFIGYTDPNLPSTIPAGATVEIATLGTGSNPSYGNVFGVGNLAIYTTLDASAVPEPSTCALIGSVALLLGLTRFRRRA